MQQVMHNMDQLSLVSQVAVPEPHDGSRRRIGFISFGSDTTADEWIAAVDRFMEEHFANFTLSAITFSGKRSHAVGGWFCRIVRAQLNPRDP